jgi:hypothetical protein
MKKLIVASEILQEQGHEEEKKNDDDDDDDDDNNNNNSNNNNKVWPFTKTVLRFCQTSFTSSGLLWKQTDRLATDTVLQRVFDYEDKNNKNVKTQLQHHHQQK